MNDPFNCQGDGCACRQERPAQPDSRLVGAAQLIVKTFRRDIEQGYVTKDKQFVLTLLEKALAQARS